MSQGPVFVVVENNQDYQDILKMAFKKSQVKGQLHFSYDSQTLFELLETLNEAPDLIVLDYELSTSNGLELARRIIQSEKWKEIPIVMFSFMENTKVKELAQHMGIKAFLAKPESYAGTIAMWNEMPGYLV